MLFSQNYMRLANDYKKGLEPLGLYKTSINETLLSPSLFVSYVDIATLDASEYIRMRQRLVSPILRHTCISIRFQCFLEYYSIYSLLSHGEASWQSRDEAVVEEGRNAAAGW